MVREMPYLLVPCSPRGAHRHLGHPGADLGGERRDEAVHLAVEVHVLQHLAAVGLQGAAVVVQVHAGHAGDEASWR